MTEYNKKRSIDLAPAKWIWVNSQRTLPNTFGLFKKIFNIKKAVKSATMTVLGSSRYLATINGKRVAWGPAPADPRYEEADCIDITSFLTQGDNSLFFKVCFFGFGDGTWVCGAPGLIYNIKINYFDGSEDIIISDKNTLAAFDNSYPAGQYKRCFLRALQEEHDFRLEGTEIYSPALELPGSSALPSSFDGYVDYISDVWVMDTSKNCIRKREIPMPVEEYLYGDITDLGTVVWNRPVDDWFRFRVPDSFSLAKDLSYEITEDGVEFELSDESNGAFVTYKLPEQGVGFVTFEITAPEGCTIEAMTQESRDEDKTLWLDTHFFSWSRHTVKEGVTKVISFEYESFIWLQLHIHNAKGKIKIKNAGMLRRYSPQKDASISFSNPTLSDLYYASVNTLKNSIIETLTDGMGRERQQYGGDCTHQIYAFSYLYGADNSLVKRYFETYTDGITSDGYYMDCWPATDRTQRLSQVQLGLSPWAPIADHPIEIILAIYNNYLETGDLSLVFKTINDFVKYAKFILSKRGEDGLVPAEGLGTIYVWIDHEGFKKQRDKCCVFNLYFAGMLKQGLAPMLKLAGQDNLSGYFIGEADNIINSANEKYYDKNRKTYIDNLPYEKEDGYITVLDRTLATGILFDTVPDTETMGNILANNEDYVTRSYPANIVWRYKALAKLGYYDCVAEDMVKYFSSMVSVKENKALQEFWTVIKGERYEMSHCPLAPVQMLYQVFLGLQPTELGYKSFKVNPKLHYLCKNSKASFTATTPSGDIKVEYQDNTIKLVFDTTQKGEIIIDDVSQPLISGKVYSIN